MRFFSRILAISHSGVSSLGGNHLVRHHLRHPAPMRLGVVERERARRRQRLDPPRPAAAACRLPRDAANRLAQDAEDVIFGVDDRQGADVMIDEQAHGRSDIVVRSDRHNLADHHIACVHIHPPRVQASRSRTRGRKLRDPRFFAPTIGRGM